ncbi:molybdopterin oxidoreductase family protein [Candidatus Magnetobacterium casense]|uniref:Molybdopterin-dependent oxidoreductase n=1 Tax=Candidatus Magnetobacterium casense TaxID=1455061 RepID=A0ABS6S1F7_9BACT|nr:nitrate reductase [Candidatus Magnetobacterium casensis]MBV6342243.1 molybdopterin-dependent oxidoreductase [Candidatus Magnetobacterium casensis]
MSTTWHKSTCPYCGFGCGLMVGVDGGRVVKVTGMKGHPTNDGRLCVLAETLPGVFDARERLTRPMLRRQGVLTEVTWQEAIGHVAGTLMAIIHEHGPDAVAFYGGASKLTEEYYLINKLMRACIGTNNIESSTRLCMASTAAGLLSTIGADAPPACYADIEHADLFFIAGNNMAVTVPVLFQRVRAAKKANGAKVIVADPRRTDTAAIADIHLQLIPGTDVALNNALAHVLLRDGFVDKEQVELYTSGLCDLKNFLKDYTPAVASQITGCPQQQIVEAAHAIGQSKAMLTFWFQGYNHSSQAVFKNNTLHNLSLLTGNFCRVGAGPISITGESNALGCRFVGALSHLLPGMRLVTNATHRQEVADFWGIPAEKIKPVPGRSIIDIIAGLHNGEIKALWVASTNPAASLPHTRWVQQGLAKAQLLVVADIFHPTETTMLANVILPAAQWGEKTGTFVSSERRIELVEKFVQPPGEALPDYEIMWLIARQMGFEREFPYTSPEDVFEEWKGLTRGRLCDTNGVTYRRLRGAVGPQLPCPTPEHPGTERLFGNLEFARPDGRAALLARKYIPPLETPDEEYPLMLITGRLACQFNTRTRTGRIDRLYRSAAGSFVEVSTEDARVIGVTEGDVVRVSSRRGSVVAEVMLSERIRPGTVFIPCHFGGALGGEQDRLVNLVTNPVYDIHSKQPEFKLSAVRIVRAE